MNSELTIAEINNKFVVLSNGKPIELPKTNGASIITEFDSKQDAERYVSILLMLKNK
jgi:hypothetical protein